MKKFSLFLFISSLCLVSIFSSCFELSYFFKSKKNNLYAFENKVQATNSCKENIFVYSDFFGKELKIDTKDLISISSQYNMTDNELLLKVVDMGFSKIQALHFVFLNFEDFISNLCYKLNVAPVDAKLNCDINQTYLSEGKNGTEIDKDDLYEKLYNVFTTDNSKISVVNILKKPSRTKSDLEKLTFRKGRFTTYINGVNQEGRINNIAIALKKFNNFELKSGQTFSFNQMIGETNEANGYLPAKIIVKGKFVDGLGGGVCQAATTLYNACLLAGLDIVEANPHSLKVGYVASSFDAMVSPGISDLRIKNNTGDSVFFATECTDTYVKVCVYGCQNEYEIERRSQTIDFDQEQYPDISYKSESYLDYYKNGVKQFEKKLRSDTYKKVVV